MAIEYSFYDKKFDYDLLTSASIIEKVHMFIPVSIPHVASLNLEYYNNKYEKKEKMNIALKFLENNLPDIISFADSLLGFGFLKSEINFNLYRALYLSSIGFYKEAIITLRSALELTLYFASYFMAYKNYDKYIPKQIDIEKFKNEILNKLSKEEDKKFLLTYYIKDSSKTYYFLKNKKKIEDLKKITDILSLVEYKSFDDYFENKDLIIDAIKNWSKSKDGKDFNTPRNIDLLNILKSKDNIKLFDKTNFEKDYNDLYIKLCNFTHTKGISNSHLKSNKYDVNFDLPPVYNEKALKKFYNLFIKSMQIIAILFVTANPVLINEDFAYQFEIQTGDTLDGHGLWGNYTSIFFDLIPDKYNIFFKQFHITEKNE